MISGADRLPVNLLRAAPPSPCGPRSFGLVGALPLPGFSCDDVVAVLARGCAAGVEGWLLPRRLRGERRLLRRP